MHETGRTAAKFIAVAGLLGAVLSVLFTPTDPDAMDPVLAGTVSFLAFLGSVGYLVFAPR